MAEKIKTPEETFLAVSSEDYNHFGCPHCGFFNGPVGPHDESTFSCGECKAPLHVLPNGKLKATIGHGIGEDKFFYPILIKHPKEGTPYHTAPDRRPDDGNGEFFNSRPVGYDMVTCFCCKDKNKVNQSMNNIAGFVVCKEAGERVIALFDTYTGGARLDYRPHQPNYVQVKIGACKKHFANLEKLAELVSDGVITRKKIKEAMNLT